MVAEMTGLLLLFRYLPRRSDHSLAAHSGWGCSLIVFTGDRVKIFLFYSSFAVLTLDWLLDWFEEDMSYLRRVEIRCRKKIVCEERKDIASFGI